MSSVKKFTSSIFSQHHAKIAKKIFLHYFKRINKKNDSLYPIHLWVTAPT